MYLAIFGGKFIDQPLFRKFLAMQQGLQRSDGLENLTTEFERADKIISNTYSINTE